MKTLIFGDGFLGHKFYDYLVQESEEKECRLTNCTITQMNGSKQIRKTIEKYRPDVIINCIGKTGRPNVDWCETHKDETFFSNVTIPILMAEICKDMNIYMVHMGSGCIYEGDNKQKGWSENDEPNFFGSFYSKTKMYSEKILKLYDNILQLRLRMPIDDKPGERNLIDKLISYKYVLGDIPNSVTCLPDFMEASEVLIDKRETGIFNMVQYGTITHKRILELYKQIVNPDFKMPEFISMSELMNITITGRSNCVLTTYKTRSKTIKMGRHVEDAIKSCLHSYLKYITQ